MSILAVVYIGLSLGLLNYAAIVVSGCDVKSGIEYASYAEDQ